MEDRLRLSLLMTRGFDWHCKSRAQRSCSAIPASLRSPNTRERKCGLIGKNTLQFRTQSYFYFWSGLFSAIQVSSGMKRQIKNKTINWLYRMRYIKTGVVEFFNFWRIMTKLCNVLLCHRGYIACIAPNHQAVSCIMSPWLYCLYRLFDS